MGDLRDLREKYRPKILSEVWGNDYIKRNWSGYLRKGFFPHSIILHSTFGMGKTTLARIFMKDIINFEKRTSGIDCDATEYDCSVCDFEYLQSYLQRIATFILLPVRAIFLDEAQKMSEKAQGGFLKKTEDMNGLTFIFATTEISKFNKGFLSRSRVFNLELPKYEVLFAELEKISALEKIRIEKEALNFLIDSSGLFPRECLGNLETLSLYDGVIDLRIAKELLAQ